MAAQIIPAILTSSFEDLKRQIHKIDGLFPYVQIDIMDGQFVQKTSFQEVEKVKGIGAEIKYELHLMVNDPVSEMKKWVDVPNVFRVICHIESQKDIEKAWEFAKKINWEFGIAINPDTPSSALDPHLNCIDLAMFMTVYPGRQGAPFQEKVIPKIREFLALQNRPKCAIDGGITVETILKIHDLPVDIINVGSALMLSPDIEKAYRELQSKL
jgi:ribulose-phosphate 3-epimerase